MLLIYECVAKRTYMRHIIMRHLNREGFSIPKRTKLRSIIAISLAIGHWGK